jgi:hypothetical protein
MFVRIAENAGETIFLKQPAVCLTTIKDGSARMIFHMDGFHYTIYEFLLREIFLRLEKSLEVLPKKN